MKWVEKVGLKPLTNAVTAKEFLRRQKFRMKDVINFIGPTAEDLDEKIIELIEIQSNTGVISKRWIRLRR